MNAEIIAVGSELLTPSRIDTNSLYLTAKLNDIGVEVVAKAVIGDDRSRLAAAVREALVRSNIVLLSGGLGPTEDDVTRDGVAEALARKLIYRQELCDQIAERFGRMKKRMAEINKRQAYLVEGAEALANPNGTAPGQWVAAGDGKVAVLLPGPPRELRPMFESFVLPRLEKFVPPQVIRVLHYRVCGMGESDLDALISPVYKQYTNPVTTVLASPGDVQIHLRARCDTAVEAEDLLASIGPKIDELLGDKIYTHSLDTLEAVVGKLLRERGATLAVAESCSAGMLAQRVTDISGASDYFAGGFIVYSAELKQKLLGVDTAMIEAHSVVSHEVARAMAAAAKEKTGATHALSVTGEAGPESATGAEPGTVFIGLAGPRGVTSKRFHFLGARERIRILSAQTALDCLRRELLGI